jgi:hypothetical protein
MPSIVGEVLGRPPCRPVISEGKKREKIIGRRRTMMLAVYLNDFLVLCRKSLPILLRRLPDQGHGRYQSRIKSTAWFAAIRASFL